jgi:hypothetical protein
MDPDLLITTAFGSLVGQFAIGGAVLVRHEWRRRAVERADDAERREFPRPTAAPTR